MSGFFILDYKTCYKYIEFLDVRGFKFLYSLLKESNGNLKVCEIAFTFKERKYGKSKLGIKNIFLYFYTVFRNFY